MSIDPQAIETASLTDVGRKRSANQDYFGSVEHSPEWRLLILADGMGGHAGGETASRVAVETVEAVCAGSDLAPGAMIVNAIEEANRAVFATAQSDPAMTGMGTTAVLLLLGRGNSGWVAHVGDSRAYRFRQGHLEQLTLDHSVVAELVRQNVVSAEEAKDHPRRNEVLRSVGVAPDVEVDLTALEVEPGDQYLLCSDGLSGVVGDDEIAAVLLQQAPEDAVRTLVSMANERGGPDNVTVQIARCPGGAALETSLPPAVDLEASTLPPDPRRGQRRRARVIRLVLAIAIVTGLLLLALLAALFFQLRSAPPATDPAASPDAPIAPSAVEDLRGTPGPVD